MSGSVTAETVFPVVVARVREIASSGEGNCYLRFYLTGHQHFEEQVVIEGWSEDDQQLAIDDSTAIGALVSVIAGRAKMDAARIEALERRLDAAHQQQLVGNEQLVLLSVAHDLLRTSGQQSAMAEALKALAPVAASVLPIVLQAMGSGGGDAGEALSAAASAEDQAPLSPEVEIDRLVALIATAVRQLVDVVRQHPHAVGGRLAPLEPIIVGIAPLFRLRVVREGS